MMFLRLHNIKITGVDVCSISQSYSNKIS